MQQPEPELTHGQILAESIGKTLESVLAQYKADPLKVGPPITNHGGVSQLHVTLTDPTLKQKFRVRAAEDGLSMSKAISLLMAGYVGERLSLEGELDLPADQ